MPHIPTEHIMKYPRNTWSAELEVRKLGAIGIFEWREFETRAERRDLERYLIEDANMQGFETRGIRNIKRLDEIIPKGESK